ncbi:hypothetical protein [Streptomyces asiaticus]|uniref:hypothetical protein n=1 Tax=Streptomyces asiaticus TaxID=114695 RepID=UPI003F680350
MVSFEAGSYEQELAKARAEGTAWPCHCGDDNPGHYDACHTCQTPSWDCPFCEAANCSRIAHCRRCQRQLKVMGVTP